MNTAYDTVTEHLLATLRDVGADVDVTGEVADRLEQMRDEVVAAPAAS